MSDAVIQTLASIAGLNASDERVSDRLERLLQFVRERAAEGEPEKPPRKSEINDALEDVQDKVNRLSKSMQAVNLEGLLWACENDRPPKLAQARQLVSKMFWLEMKIREVEALCKECKVSAQKGKNKNHVLSDIAANCISIMLESRPDKIPKKATEASPLFKLFDELVFNLGEKQSVVSHLDILNRELADPKTRRCVIRAQELHAVMWGESDEKI